MIAYVKLDSGEWSIAWLDEGAFEWWCGWLHEWVSPHSSYWAAVPDCWNQTFPRLQDARAYAHKHRLEVP